MRTHNPRALLTARTKSYFGVLPALCMIAAVVLSGCTPEQPAHAYDNLTCEQATAQLATAKQSLEEHKKALAAVENDGTPASLKYQNDIKEDEAAITALEKRANNCKQDASQSADKAQSPQSLPSSGTSGVIDANRDKGGKVTAGESREDVPLVTTLPGAQVTADTVQAGAPSSLIGCKHQYLTGWDTLVDCVKDANATWYIKAVNDRAQKTGFSWSDVEAWASARLSNDRLPEVRVIVVHGHESEINDAEARRRAIPLVGEDVAKRLNIVRRPAVFINTWTPDGKSLEDYTFDPEPQNAVRVALMPLKLNANKHVVEKLNYGAGIFVDCFNVYWEPYAVNLTSGKPPKTPKTPPTNTPPSPGSNTPPPAPPGGGTPPPAPPVPPAPKDTSQNPVVQGDAGNGKRRNADPGPGGYIPPAQMKQSPSVPWVDPTPPQPVVTEPPAVVHQPPPPPAPLEIPSAPLPKPQPTAPTPSDPAVGCSPAPGMDSCD